MGGAFFASGPDPLYTPRMPPEVYQLVKENCHRALRELYVCVASPIDGPAKKDFGDVDLLTTWSRQETLGLPPPKWLSASVVSREKGKSPDELDYIGAALGAERMVCEKGRVGAHYAIPWPTSLLALRDPDGGQAEEEREEDPRPRYIQVDVHVCPSLQSLQWILFRHAHGDLWNILGSTIRPLGLTVDESALWIRVPEIESVNRNRAKVKVTEDPAQVIRILGIDAERYGEGPFATLDELYEYAATSPMFWVRELPEESFAASADAAGGGDGDAAGKSAADAGVAEDKKRLKSNDRQRMKSRPCYRLWVEEFLPKCRAEGRFLKQSCTRESVAASIFSQFPIQDEYNQRLADFRVERQRMDIWRDEIKGFLAGLDLAGKHPAYKGCLAKALKRIVLEDDDGYGVSPAKRLKGEDGEFVMEDVRGFIRGNYEIVGEAALRDHHGRNAAPKEVTS